MPPIPALEIRDAVIPQDLPDIGRLWLDYLTWGNAEMQARHGVHPHAPREAVAQDLAAIGKFLPPDGRLFLAWLEGRPCGIGCLRRIGPGLGEIKRMYVDPACRRVGAGRALLTRLIRAAEEAGHTRVRLDSPDFMTAAHALYRSCGFTDIPPYAESEIPDEFKPLLVFMEKTLDPQ